MNWPPLELRIDQTHARLYAAGIEQVSIAKSANLTDEALDAAFEIVRQYGRDLPLTVYDEANTWSLLLTVDGQTIDTTTPVETKTKRSKRPA